MPWSTAVTEIKPDRVAVRGHDVARSMGRVSFGEADHDYDGPSPRDVPERA